MARLKMTTGAGKLADELRREAARFGPVTPLKLQKLIFYGYGALLAGSAHHEVGLVPFEPWEHGPVNREQWQRFRSFGRGPLPPPNPWDGIGDLRAKSIISDVAEVYGRMGAWALRNETHLEAPWAAAYQGRESQIYDSWIRDHFVQKFHTGDVRLPAFFPGRGSASLDRIPSARYGSLHELAQHLRWGF